MSFPISLQMLLGGAKKSTSLYYVLFLKHMIAGNKIMKEVAQTAYLGKLQ